MLGHCVKCERSKGYGFIIPLDPDDPTLADVLCHFSDIEPTAAW